MGTPVEAVEAIPVDVSVMNVTDGEPADIVGIGHPGGMLPPQGPVPTKGVHSETVLIISVAVETVLV